MYVGDLELKKKIHTLKTTTPEINIEPEQWKLNEEQLSNLKDLGLIDDKLDDDNDLNIIAYLK